MTSELSTVVQAIITDENEKYFFVQKSGETFRLKKNEATESLKIGDVVTGFLYENSSRKKVFTLRIPEVTNESYGWASVTQVRKHVSENNYPVNQPVYGRGIAANVSIVGIERVCSPSL